jgi:ketosteroid isomerase-like protein
VTPRDVVTGYFDALARHDTAAAVEFLDPEVVDEITSVGVLRGRDEVRAFFDGLFKAVPDFEMKVVRTVRERDTVVVQWRARGTFTGGPLYNGVQATGAELQMRGCDVFDVRGDLIVANIAFADGLELARSLGMFPPQDSPAEKAMIGAFNGATKVRTALRDRFGSSGG